VGEVVQHADFLDISTSVVQGQDTAQRGETQSLSPGRECGDHQVRGGRQTQGAEVVLGERETVEPEPVASPE
jgi:hypothetical protein